MCFGRIGAVGQFGVPQQKRSTLVFRDSQLFLIEVEQGHPSTRL